MYEKGNQAFLLTCLSPNCSHRLLFNGRLDVTQSNVRSLPNQWMPNQTFANLLTLLISQSVNQSINQSINCAVGHAVSQLVSQSVYPSVNQSPNLLLKKSQGDFAPAFVTWLATIIWVTSISNDRVMVSEGNH